jgi:serine/threonine protein kinase
MYKPQLKPGESRIATEIKSRLPPNMAVKVFSTDRDDNFIAKLRQECNLLKTVDHPNIVKYYGFVESQDQTEASIFMELMPHSLQTSYENFGPMNERILRRHTRQILEALCYLHNHEKKIIHGDLKAANILYDGKNVKLTDFGDSRQMQKKLPTIMNVSHSGVIYQDIKGSILWMAPEVIK